MTSENREVTLVLKHKVLIYVLNPALTKLVAFRQPLSPAAGLQIPAGTVESGERPDQAAVRELLEETGVQSGSTLVNLGESRYDAIQYKAEIHVRYWFYLIDRHNDFPAEGWTHVEARHGLPDIIGQFEWVETDFASNDLIADHDRFLFKAVDLARLHA